MLFWGFAFSLDGILNVYSFSLFLAPILRAAWTSHNVSDISSKPFAMEEERTTVKLCLLDMPCCILEPRATAVVHTDSNQSRFYYGLVRSSRDSAHHWGATYGQAMWKGRVRFFESDGCC